MGKEGVRGRKKQLKAFGKVLGRFLEGLEGIGEVFGRFRGHLVR